MYYPVRRPYRQGNRASNRLSHLIDEMFQPMLERSDEMDERSFLPMNVSETEDQYIVEAQLAGADRDDISVSLEDDVLSVSHEMNVESEQDQGGVLQSEWCVQSQQRSLRLPQVDPESDPRASFSKGVLRIEVDKRPEKRRKKIDIQ